MKVIKIIKINVLALLALPLLLAATGVRLISKALQKALAIIGTIVITFAVALLFEAARDIGGALEVVVIVFAIIVIGGIFTAIVIWLLTISSALIMGAVGAVIHLLEYVYAGIYFCYTALFQICKSDYESLNVGERPAIKRVSCFLFTFLEAVNKLIILFVSHALKILAAAGVLIVVGGIVLFDIQIHRTFGVHLFEYLKLFPAYEIVSGVVLYFVFTFGIFSVLISLGLEWNEWGAEMRASTTDYDESAQNIRRLWQEVEVEQKEGKIDKNMSRCMEACESLNGHMKEFDLFVEEYSLLAEESGDYILRSYLGEYLCLLQEISEAFSSYEGNVPLSVFETYIGKIKEADTIKKNLIRHGDKVRNRKEKEAKSAREGFFSGCSTSEKLEKRYRALCKTYHPDNETGDEETFKRIREESENRKKELS